MDLLTSEATHRYNNEEDLDRQFLRIIISSSLWGIWLIVIFIFAKQTDWTYVHEAQPWFKDNLTLIVLVLSGIGLLAMIMAQVYRKMKIIKIEDVLNGQEANMIPTEVLNGDGNNGLKDEPVKGDEKVGQSTTHSRLLL